MFVCLSAVVSGADIPQETSVHRSKVYYPGLQGEGLVKHNVFASCGLLSCDTAAHWGQRDEVYRFFHTLHNSFDSKHIANSKIHVFADWAQLLPLFCLYFRS